MAAHSWSLNEFDPSLSIKEELSSVQGRTLPTLSRQSYKGVTSSQVRCEATFLTRDLLVCHVSCWKSKHLAVQSIYLPYPPVPVPFTNIQVNRGYPTLAIFCTLSGPITLSLPNHDIGTIRIIIGEGPR